MNTLIITIGTTIAITISTSITTDDTVAGIMIASCGKDTVTEFGVDCGDGGCDVSGGGVVGGNSVGFNTAYIACG